MTATHMDPSHLCSVLRDRRPTFTNHLLRYYSADASVGFRGSNFDFAEDGVDPSPNQITANDIESITRLSVKFSPEARTELLKGTTSKSLGCHFRKIDPLQELHSFDSNPLVHDSVSWNAWEVLTDKRTRSPNLKGIGQVKASKILARKRPHLFPIFDQVVACVLGFTDSKGHWEWTYNALVANNLELAGELELLRAQAATQNVRISELSLLRVLDVAVWMDHHWVHPTERGGRPCPQPKPWGLS